MEAHDLRPVDQAAAGEGHHVGLSLAPLGQGGGPLVGAAGLIRGLAAEDHAAVDEAAGDRRQLARGDRHHRLVQQREPLLRAAQHDQVRAARLGAEREQVRVAEALPDRARRAGRGGRRLEVARGLVAEHRRKHQVPLLDALGLLTLDQPLRPAHPARRPPGLAAQHEVEPEPERAARRGQPVAALEMRVVGALERAAVLLVAAEHVRGGRQPLEILGPVGARQRVVDVRPAAARSIHDSHRTPT